MKRRSINLAAMSLVEKTQKAIIDEIHKKDLKIGDRLPNETELTKMFDVGRSTIREAVKLLVSKGMLEVRQGSGTYVKQLTLREHDPLGITERADSLQAALELIDARLLLEPEICQWAAQHATEDMIDELELINSRVEEKIYGKKDYKEEDRMLHQKLVACAGNQVLEHLMEPILQSIDLMMEMTQFQLDEETIRTHRHIIEAIRQRDGISAKAAMTMHLLENRQLICQRMIDSSQREKI